MTVKTAAAFLRQSFFICIVKKSDFKVDKCRKMLYNNIMKYTVYILSFDREILKP